MRTNQGFRVELSPTAEQTSRLAEHAGLSRVVENFCLDLIRAAIDQREAERSYGVAEGDLTKVPWSAAQLEKRWLSAHPTQFPWFVERDLSSRVPKQACRMRSVGIKNWVRSIHGKRTARPVNFPVLRKSKHGRRFRAEGGVTGIYPVDSRTLKIPRVGHVASREDMSWLTDRIADGRAHVLSVTIRERAGRWWASFTLTVDRSDINTRRAVSSSAPSCGIDLGLKTFAVIANSDGTSEEVLAPMPLRRVRNKIRRAHRAMGRKTPGSANREKARVALAALHLRASNQRNDFLHKLTTRLARTKRAIAVETLNVAAMKKNRLFCRLASDAGFSEFNRQLKYKSEWYGSTVWMADRWFPSSRTCGDCGTVNRALKLKDRTWSCPCGAVHDRDHNAARNLLAAMQAA